MGVLESIKLGGRPKVCIKIRNKTTNFSHTIVQILILHRSKMPEKKQKHSGCWTADPQNFGPYAVRMIIFFCACTQLSYSMLWSWHRDRVVFTNCAGIYLNLFLKNRRYF